MLKNVAVEIAAMITEYGSIVEGKTWLIDLRRGIKFEGFFIDDLQLIRVWICGRVFTSDELDMRTHLGDLHNIFSSLFVVMSKLNAA